MTEHEREHLKAMRATSKATVIGTRETGGALKVDQFCLSIIDENGRGVEVRMTPQQWALALWSRGDIIVDATWFDMVPAKEATCESDT